MNKQYFLQNEVISQLKTIHPSMQPLFGKMNVQQMVEHMSYAFQQASGLIPLPAINDAETTEKMYRFMMSEKPFRDNTPNVYLPDEPTPAICKTIEESLLALQKDIEVFFAVFEKNNDQKILNPFFGDLNFEEWVHLLHKHALHHLRQFGINL